MNQTLSIGLCIALCIRSNTTYIIHLVILLQVDPSMKIQVEVDVSLFEDVNCGYELDVIILV